ncbi:MAG TPA: hypothetical protein VLF18_16835 [Tahibacter sp.]|uniref:hypothetical protein n=1 Tax=Tahibacter sp. TaxID=2056211 RepID=UPI002C8D67B2|nr:hypothetical protein [Tahibacter sp.]HSX61858.1 hypothetical protein [Tahibacter sp.]
MNAIRRISSLSLFHRALLLDLSTCIPTAALLIAGADALAPLTGLPVELLRYAGFVLVPFGVLLALTLSAARPNKFAAWSIMEINLAWVVASFYVLYGAGLQPTAAGSAVVIAQALGVLGIAALQFAGWRRLGTANDYTGSVAARA